MSFLIFNGIPSTAVHAKIAQLPEYKIPERPYSSFYIDGKNGASIIDSKYYSNIEITYTMIVDVTKHKLSFLDIASAIANWLHPFETSKKGYYQLIESYDPTHFRWAKVKGDISIANILNKAGTFDITFECMPQRFLVYSSSESELKTQHNLTSCIAKPIFTFTSSAANGYVQFANTSNSTKYYHRIICSTSGSTQTIDSVEEDCYNGSSNKNSVISFQHSTNGSNWSASYDFPELYPGVTSISLSNATNFKIISNLWEL